MSIFFKDPALRKLTKIALFGAAATLATGFYFQSKIRRNIIDTPFYKQSLEILHNNTGEVTVMH